MKEIHTAGLGPDELFLAGRLQVDTAITVLSMTGVNPRAEAMLTSLREAHSVATALDAQRDLSVYLRGEQAAAMKADIVVSALLAEQNPGLTSADRIAAGGLVTVLGAEK